MAQVSHRFEWQPINPDLLQEEMKASFYEYQHLNATGGEWVEFVFDEELSEDKPPTREAVEAVFKAHDANKLTKRQQLQRDRAEAFIRRTAIDMDALEVRLMGASDVEFRREVIAFMRDFTALLFAEGG
jgi:hypothetical protein